MAVMEVIISAIDQASDVVGGIADKTKAAAGAIKTNWVAIGAAGAAAGAAFEAAARSQAPLTEQTKKLAASLDMTTDEVRDLAIGMSNVTFPIEDVLALMETGKQRGLDTAEALERYATNWDMIGDATGLAGPMLAEAGVALQILGISAGEEEKALAAFGYITEHTTSNVADFMNIIERVGPEMADMGMDIDDAAALLGILENEMGLTGRAARQELQAAIKDADGDMGKMLETLGVSSDTFGEYRQQVSDSSDIIQRNADIHEESYTTLQKMQHAASELTYKYGDLIGTVGNLAPLMMGLGPIIKGLSLAKGAMAAITSGSLIPAIGAAATSVWTFTAALLANPITWIVVAIIALIAAIVLLWKNWDQVSEWLIKSWEVVKEKAAEIWGAIVELFTNIWEGIKGIFSGGTDAVKNKASETWSSIKDTTENVWGNIKDFFGKTWDSIREIGDGKAGELLDRVTGRFTAIFEFITEIWDEIVRFFTEIWEAIKALFRGDLEAVEDHLRSAYGRIFEFIGEIWTRIKNFFADTWKTITATFSTALGTTIDRIKSWVTDLWSNAQAAAKRLTEGFMDTVKNLPNLLGDTLKAVVTKIMSFGGELWNAAKKAGESIWGGIKNGLGISSPSYAERAIDAIAERASRLPGEMKQSFSRLKDITPEFGDGDPGFDFGGDWPGPPGTGMAGPRTINVTVELDSETLLRAIGEPLVEEIRLKAALRI